MGEPLLPIIAEITIERPIDKVWDVLVGEATLPQWLGALDYKPVVGSTFFMQQDPERQAAHDTDGATWCDVALMQKPHKFNFSWYLPGTPETFVQISLFSEGERKTFVRLMHDGWDEFEREAMEGFYEQLAARLEERSAAQPQAAGGAGGVAARARRQTLWGETVPGGYSKSSVPVSVKPRRRQRAFEAAFAGAGKA